MKRVDRKFTKHDLDTAVKVLMESVIVKNWVSGMAKSFNIRLDTLEGRVFYEREARAAAERLIK